MGFELDKQVKEWINRVEPYVPGEMREGYIKLASNENNYGPTPKVAEALKENIKTLNIYRYRDTEVRESIAEYCKVGRDNVVVGNGSDELIELILKVFKSPVLSFNPSFAEYRISSQILGEKNFEVNLNPDFSFPTKKFIESARKAGILFLCSPNNPTGTVIPVEDIKEVLELGKITVIDEAYFEFYGETSAPLLEDYTNLIILRTFSKAFALGGLRIGYALTSPKIAELLYKVRLPFSVNSFAEVAALAALRDLRFMEGNVDRIVCDRDALFKELNSRYRAFRSQANFILVDSLPLKSEDFFNKLFERKIIVRKLGVFPGFRGDYTRFSVGTSEENQKLIEALEDM